MTGGPADPERAGEFRAARWIAGVSAFFWAGPYFGLTDLITALTQDERFADTLVLEAGWGLLFTVLVPGTVANAVAHGLSPIADTAGICTVAMRKPAGVLRARIGANLGAHGLRVTSVAYERSAQLFLRGHFPVYSASSELRQFAERW